MSEGKVFFLVAATATALGHAACSTDGAIAPAHAAPAAVQGAETTPEPPSAPRALRDAQIVQIAQLIDHGEIAQARIAAARGRDLRVQSFAHRAIRQHTDNKLRSEQWIAKTGATPEASATATQLESRTTRALRTLEALDPGLFDTMYVDAQVEQHRRVLDMLEFQLIPNASDPALRSQLELTRDLVANHLADATQLQAALGR